MKTNKLDPELVAKVSPALKPDETLLWVGEPNPLSLSRVLVRRKSITQGSQWHDRILMGAFILALLIVTSVSIKVPALLLPAVIVSVLALILIFISPYLSVYGVARQTVYGLTDQRALFISPKSVEVVDMMDTIEFEHDKRTETRSNVVFRYDIKKQVAKTFLGDMMRMVIVPVGFIGIEDGERVAKLIREHFNIATVKMKPDRPNFSDLFNES